MGRPKGRKITILIMKWMTGKRGNKYRRYFSKAELAARKTRAKRIGPLVRKPAEKIRLFKVDKKTGKLVQKDIGVASQVEKYTRQGFVVTRR